MTDPEWHQTSDKMSDYDVLLWAFKKLQPHLTEYDNRMMLRLGDILYRAERAERREK